MHDTATPAPSQPNLVVGWAAGLLQVWPAEDRSIDLRPSTPSRGMADDRDAHRLAS